MPHPGLFWDRVQKDPDGVIKDLKKQMKEQEKTIKEYGGEIEEYVPQSEDKKQIVDELLYQITRRACKIRDLKPKK